MALTSILHPPASWSPPTGTTGGTGSTTGAGTAPGAVAGATTATPPTPASPAPATTSTIVVTQNGDLRQFFSLLGVQYSTALASHDTTPGGGITWSEITHGDNQLSLAEAQELGISKELYDLMTKYMNAGGTAADQIVSLEEFARAANVIQWFADTYGYTINKAVEMYNNPTTPMVTVDRAAVNASSSALTPALGTAAGSDLKFANLTEVRTALSGLQPPATQAEIDTVIASLTTNGSTTNVSAQMVAQYLLRTRVHGSPVSGASGTGIPVTDESLMALARTYKVLSSQSSANRPQQVLIFIRAVIAQYGAAAAERALNLLLQEALQRSEDSAVRIQITGLIVVNANGALTINDNDINATLANAWANEGNSDKALSYACAIQDTYTKTQTIRTIANKLLAALDLPGAYRFILEITDAETKAQLLNSLFQACLNNFNPANYQLAVNIVGQMTITDKSVFYAKIIAKCLEGSSPPEVRRLAVELLEGKPTATPPVLPAIPTGIQFSSEALQVLSPFGIVANLINGQPQAMGIADLLAQVRPLVTIDQRILSIQNQFIQIDEHAQQLDDKIKLRTSAGIDVALTTLDAIINDPNADPYSVAQARYVRGLLLFGLARTTTTFPVTLTINGMPVTFTAMKDLLKEAMYQLRAAWEACKVDPHNPSSAFRQGAEWKNLMANIFGRMVNIVDAVKNTSTFAPQTQRNTLANELVQFVPNYGTGSIAITYLAFSSSTTSAARPRSPEEYRKSIYSGIGSKDAFGAYQSLLNPVEGAVSSLDTLAGQLYSNVDTHTVRTNLTKPKLRTMKEQLEAKKAQLQALLAQAPEAQKATIQASIDRIDQMIADIDARMAAAPNGPPPPAPITPADAQTAYDALPNRTDFSNKTKSELIAARASANNLIARLKAWQQANPTRKDEAKTLITTIEGYVSDLNKAIDPATGGGASGNGSDPIEALMDEKGSGGTPPPAPSGTCTGASAANPAACVSAGGTWQ